MTPSDLENDQGLRPGDLKSAFLSWMETPETGDPYSKHTIRAYGRAIERFLEYISSVGAVSLNEVNSLVLRGYFRPIVQGGANSRASQEKNAISAFFDWAWGEGMIQGNPVRTMMDDRPHARRGGRKPKELQEVLFSHEIADLLEFVSSSPRSVAGRDLAAIGLFLDSGLREAEMCSLDVVDARNLLRAGQLRVTGKGRKDRLVRPLPHYISLLEAHLADMPDHGPLWLSQRGARMSEVLAYKMVNGYLKRSGIKKSQMGPHLLRHTAASRMLAEGMNIRLVQENMGHASIRTTEKYLHLFD